MVVFEAVSRLATECFLFSSGFSEVLISLDWKSPGASFNFPRVGFIDLTTDKFDLWPKLLDCVFNAAFCSGLLVLVVDSMDNLLLLTAEDCLTPDATVWLDDREAMETGAETPDDLVSKTLSVDFLLVFIKGLD